jgi:hypothetical protein
MSNKNNIYAMSGNYGNYSYLGEIPGACNPFSNTLFQHTTPGNVLVSTDKDCNIGEANINGLCQSIIPSNCNGYTYDTNCNVSQNNIGCGSDLAGLGVYQTGIEKGDCVGLDVYMNKPMDPMVVLDSKQLWERGYDALSKGYNNDMYDESDNGNYFMYGRAYPNADCGTDCSKYALRNCCLKDFVQLQSRILTVLKERYSIVSDNEKKLIFNSVFGNTKYKCTPEMSVQECDKLVNRNILKLERELLKAPIDKQDAALLEDLKKLLGLQDQYLQDGGQAILMDQFLYFPYSWFSILNRTDPAKALQLYKNTPEVLTYFSTGQAICDATVNNFKPMRTISDPTGEYNYVPMNSMPEFESKNFKCNQRR